MKKLLSLMLAFVMTAALCIGLNASSTPKTNVTYGVDPTYSITIPQTLAAGNNLEIGATVISTEPGYQVAVTVSGGLSGGLITLIRRDKDDFPETPLVGLENVLYAPFTLGSAAVTGTTQLAVFSGTSTTNQVTDTLTVGTPDITGKKAGTYKGTVTFSISYQSAQEPLGDATAITPNAQGEYVIMSGTDWLWFKQNASNLAGKTIKLGKNLDMTLYGNTMIANLPDQATFDGQNHTITVGISTNNVAGVFSYVNSGTIKNLTSAGSISTTGLYAGMVGAFNSNQYSNKYIYMDNCVNKATVYANCPADGLFTCAGGIVGEVLSESGCTVQITNCSNEGQITGINNLTVGCAGGIVGYYDGVSTLTNLIQNCANTGLITASFSNSAGGMLGYSRRNLTIDTCTNSGEIYYDVNKITSAHPIYGIRDGGFGGTLVVTNCTPNTQNGTF